MPETYVAILLPLGSAWLAGGLVGLEREHHGRPAGFRTHALVCLASALLMQAMIHQWDWLGAVPLETVRTDPTRMAQAIMMGIGFLGAGVIFREGLAVRGLTTAASIWVTAVLGILYGVGFWFAAVVGTAIVLVTLFVFRRLERWLPEQYFVQQKLRFAADCVPARAEIADLMARHGFEIVQVSHALVEGGAAYELRLVTATRRPDRIEGLAAALRERPDVVEFTVAPGGA